MHLQFQKAPVSLLATQWAIALKECGIKLKEKLDLKAKRLISDIIDAHSILARMRAARIAHASEV